MKKLNYILLATFAITLTVFTACKKKFENPPVKTPPAMTGSITVDSIYKTYTAYYFSSPAPTTIYKFNGDVNLTATVTADEVSGNLYKQVYVADGSGNRGLQVRLVNAGGLYVGDIIRINLNGVILNDYGSVVQLDSVDIEKRVVKVSSGNIVAPTKITFNQMFETDGFGMFKFQSRLIQIDSVEFTAGDKNQTFADGPNKNTLNRSIESSTNNQPATVRTSGYCNFASQLTPCGKGSIVAILGQYNSDPPQLTLRDHAGVKLDAGICPLTVKSFNSPFDANISNGGWSNYNVTGSINWVGSYYGGQEFGKISNYVGGANQTCETWLISPRFDISGAANPFAKFQSAYNYTGPAIQMLVSTNYTGGNPTAATWTVLTPTIPSAGGYVWTKSGDVSLSAYKSSNTTIAFKYTGTSSAGSTWEIDDIAVFPQ